MDNSQEPINNQEDDNTLDINKVLQLIVSLMAANSVQYPRLQARLDALKDLAVTGNVKQLSQSVSDLISFISTYHPIDPKMGEFLKQYGQTNSEILSQLQMLVGEPKLEATPKIQPAIKPKLNIKKNGLYRFQFYMHEKLNLGNISNMKTIRQNMNISATHYKLWKEINGIPFLVNGYPDDAYSCVTRVLASQAGKLLSLQCEEVFFGDHDGKPVTLTAFHDVVTLLENETFKLYPMASNYDYQSEQKRAFYFLIQHWTAYAVVSGQVKERFERHFIDHKGNIFLSQHDLPTFLTPQQMAPSLMVRLTIAKENYRPIRDLVIRMGDKDLADIVFSSIPLDMVEEHDRVASSLNKPTFDQRKESFESNWDALVDSLDEFESLYGV